MAAGRPFRSPFTLLALGILVAGALVVNTLGSGRVTEPGGKDGFDPSRTDPGRSGPGVDPPRKGSSAEPEVGPGFSPGMGTAVSDSSQDLPGGVLEADAACLDVGYLCAGLASDSSVQLIRWPRSTPRILILVPEPEGLPDGLAREIQRAAVRGIQAWQDHPIPLRVRTRESRDPPDIQVQWARRVEDGRLGRAGVRWRAEGGLTEFQVEGFLLATHHPQAQGRPLDPATVELVAAHEMGHALGLPHSDDPRDVMFPENTATRLTVRDFRTVEALYRLPNGVEIRR